MGGFVKTFLKAGLGLASATVLVLGLQAQAAAAETMKPGAVLLAQSAEPKTEKAPVTAPPATKPGPPKVAPRPATTSPPAKPGQPKAAPPPARRMMREAPAPGAKPGAVQEAPAASGTKRIGGGTIRDKKGSEDE